MSSDMMATPPDGWRLQSTTNRQGSGGTVERFPDNFHPDDIVEEGGVQYHVDGVRTAGEWLPNAERRFQRRAREVYEERLRFGVAREQARLDLPMSVYIKVVWKIDLHNLLHFLALRMDAHAQQEICAYAEVIGREIVAPLFPLTWEAFCQYRLEAITLTALDIEAIRRRETLVSYDEADPTDQRVVFGHIENGRERDECRRNWSGSA
jgi:thymidylate synthase (FAD)